MPSTICSTSQRCRLLKSFFYCMTLFIWGFPHSSVGKESSCNAGDLASIPGSRRSAGEGIGYPPQYSWASLVAQLVKYLSAMWKTWVQSLGWEDPLEKGKSTHSSILAWRVRHNWVTFTSLHFTHLREKAHIVCCSRDITLPTKVCLIKAMVFPVVMYG